MNLAIYGYGNLGRGVECAVRQQKDMRLVGIFTRRDPNTVTPLTDVPVYAAQEVLSHRSQIDVLILCGGSATDLPHMTPELAAHFNVVDSFDTHAAVSRHFDAVDRSAKAGGRLALISAGWDPGLFSLNRLYAQAVLPQGADYTFWGPGVSQGHSDAVRRIDGVLDARQYTLPIDQALDAARSGDNPHLTVGEKHTRLCYVVAEEGADRARIEQEIKTMPNYFDQYQTTVRFISAEEMQRDHAGMPHGGFVIRTGRTGLNDEHRQVIEYRLKLDSNPEFTACVLVACARAIDRMHRRGQTGCRTIFDLAPGDLSPLSPEQLRAQLL